MQCRGCDYPLWNLPPGQCPECGLEFKPSEYQFVPASVAFCCPMCDQSYFGTSVDGHLVPSSFKCLSCSAEVDMDSMVVRPAEDRPHAMQIQGVAPCMQPDRWAITKWFGTLGWSVGMPGVLVGQIPVQRSLELGCKFFIPVALLVAIGSSVPFLFLFSGLLNLRSYLGANALVAVLSAILSIALIAANLFLFMVLWALVAHVWLAFRKKAVHGFGRTLSSFMFASGPLLLLAVPCLGTYCGIVILPFWLFVLSIFALRSARWPWYAVRGHTVL